ncbi:capsular exopolysaccharide biosynthesis protein [Xenococcus sp. PCC 7305]|uniref:GumC family protein n=1 Tax=Xenococcus sp. PCC 7305 TaxID=102125 RepID=UPI0002ABC267|nr:polysaccharide biosynthesis tyrosine autokinase [Xenococcus sp. PCC 7305]ELS04963.1 capsular exopolysaccharide biosynthesis protein [Xenococcus sp. PCC 7305]
MNQSKKSWHQYWLALKYYKSPAIAIFLSTIILAITAALKIERTYTVNSIIQLESPNQEIIDALGQEEADKSNNSENIEPETSETGEISEEPAANLPKQVFEQVQATDNGLEDLDYNQFAENLEIKNDSLSDTIEITYSGKDIDSSKLVVNSLIESYREQQAQTEISNVEKIKDKVNQQLTVADKNATEIANKLKALLTKYDRNILESKPDYLTNKIKELEEKIAAAKSKIKEVDDEIAGLKTKLGLNLSPNAIAGEVSDSPEQQQLLEKLQEVETQLIIEGARFNSQSPVIINLEAEKAKLEAQIKDQNIATQQYVSVNQNNNSIAENTEKLVGYEAEKKSLSAKVASWEIDKARYQKDNAIAPEVQQQYQELVSKNKRAKEKYNKLLTKAQQLDIFSEDNIAQIKIITPPQVKKSLASWNKEIIAASGVGLGFMLAFVAVLILEKRNPTLKNIAEIGEVGNSKVLGEIPNLRKSDFHISHRCDPVDPERFVLEAPYSVACESYKIVYDNLAQISSNQVIKTITVTSSNTAEGKSTFIANLAALTTQLGKKVLIIDTNLHTPKQKAIWRIDNNLGLTDILKKDVEFDNVVQAPSLNLNVITAGSMVEDYLSLWQSESMKEFMLHVREKYDLILLDTSAVDLSTDILNISQFTDGIILVGRIGFTNPHKLLEAQELIKASNQELLGIVVNDKFKS